jgi:hypothetical protein
MSVKGVWALWPSWSILLALEQCLLMISGFQNLETHSLQPSGHCKLGVPLVAPDALSAFITSTSNTPWMKNSGTHRGTLQTVSGTETSDWTPPERALTTDTGFETKPNHKAMQLDFVSCRYKAKATWALFRSPCVDMRRTDMMAGSFHASRLHMIVWEFGPSNTEYRNPRVW